jgi:predicted CoA-binding protein
MPAGRTSAVTYATVDPREVLRRYRIIAVVGASRNPEKDAHRVPAYLKEKGYRIIPINPSAQEILGERAYPSLSGLPEEVARSVEVVDVFRPSEELPQVAKEAVELKKKYGRPFVFWAQLGLENADAARLLQDAGIGVVMDACMMQTHRLMSLYERP